MNGTQILMVFLELRNVSDLGNPLYLYFKPSACVAAEVYDSAGKPVPQAGLPASIMAPMPFLIALPWDSTLKMNVTAIGYGVPANEKALIGLNRSWVIKNGDTGDYYLGGKFTAIDITKPQNWGFSKSDPIEPPESQFLRETHNRSWAGDIDIPKTRIDALNPQTPGPAVKS